MQLRRLGETDIRVTPLLFGAWAIGGFKWGGTDREAAVSAIKKAIDMGINGIDTAPIYGFGLSEEIVAEAVSGIRDRIYIFTKCGLRWDLEKGEFFYETADQDGMAVRIYKYSGKEGIIYECEQSLKRLRTDYIDLYQIHWPDSTTSVEETMEALDKLLKEGKIRAAGVSNYSVQQLDNARRVIKIVSNQVPYSMVNRGIESDLVPYCIENNVSILAYSPLQRGLLTGKVTPDYRFRGDDHRKDNPFFTIKNRVKVLNLLEKIKPIAEAHNATPAQIVLAWTIRRPGITAALAGTRNPSQAEENFSALEIELSDEEMVRITKYADEIKLDV